MKEKKMFVVGILLLVMVMLTGCGTEKKDSKNEENQANDNASASVGASYFVEYKGSIYYWKINEESREQEALSGNYGRKIGAANYLVKRDSDGSESVVLTDTGDGNIYIANDMIFYQQNDNGTYKVCSVGLDGSDKKIYVDGEIKYAYGDYLYIQSLADVVALNVKNGIDELKVEKADLIGMAGENAYYIAGDAGKEVSINYIKGSLNNLNIATFSTSEYKETDKANANITLYDFSYMNNKVKIKVADVQGTAHFIQESWIIEMDADGQNVTKKQEVLDSDGNNAISYYTELPVSYDFDKGLVYENPENGEKKTIMDKDKIKIDYGFRIDNESCVSVYSANRIGDKLYIVIDNGIHYPAGDIGWRYSYRRIKTVAFKYDLGSGKIEKIYEF